MKAMKKMIAAVMCLCLAVSPLNAFAEKQFFLTNLTKLYRKQRNSIMSMRKSSLLSAVQTKD